MQSTIISVCAAIGLMTTAAQAEGESALEKSKRDAIAQVKADDPIMDAAFRKARKSLKQFLALAQNPRPSITNYAVKIGVVDGAATEYFWISRFVQQDGLLIGRIDNTPRSVKNVREGQKIRFEESDVVDWLYRENGKMTGNFTACALISKESSKQAEAFKKEYGLTCDTD